MCGRFALNRAIAQLRALLNVNRVVENGRRFAPSNNIAPGTTAPIVANNEIRLMNWGMSVRDRTVINARSETVATTFASDVSERRCVIPADGYFEWNKEKQPFFFKTGEDLMFLAGFYTKNGDFVILTREGSSQVSAIHHRMPIILTMAQIEDWVGSKWTSVLGYVPPVLTFFAVSRYSLRSGYTGDECVAPIKGQTKTQRKLEDLLKPKPAIK